ncbi:MAG: ATP-grasp domain-containing protein [Myxococcales bacterium]|nr:ATP-grasp domain-containing protein [Myxococcales bacterium]MDD9969458.1 ATP-grasp domain-containing protein [Myxococcales bacterium]
MFEKVLIANRGEIAVRIARTCERLGIATVAVHSDIEAEALHVSTCDEAVCIGEAPARGSYLNATKIIEAAKQTGANAIHPGYGFLSENPHFARAVEEAGLAFVGPTAEAIGLFGDKLKARELAAHAGVRVVPGTELPLESAADAVRAADDVGYPVMLKAAAGGGGIGLQRSHGPEDLEEAFATCQRRAEAAFGDGRVFLERLIERPRHLEVQVVADSHGQYVALGERECSIQRRHQKLLEESPSPAFVQPDHGDLKREILCDAALRIAREANFANVGTAEFLMDAQDRIYFVEFNPRLQVEHGVTEMCTGLDLVELQLRIAAGEKLPPEAIAAQPTGHAMEARLYAEDATQNFIPRPGQIENLRWPMVAPGALRIETGVTAGSTMTPHYDPLIAKLIAYAPTRHQALLTLDRVLAETVLTPLTTNLGFLRQVLAHEAFRAGQYDTDTTAEILANPPAPDASESPKKPGPKTRRRR